MHIPKNYFHDRHVLAIISVNSFLAIVTSLLVIFRLRSSSSEGLVGQYHANLGLSAFEPGSTIGYLSFVVFALLVLVLHTLLSMRMYHKRRDYAVVILWMGLCLLVLALIVSNALSVLQ